MVTPQVYRYIPFLFDWPRATLICGQYQARALQPTLSRHQSCSGFDDAVFDAGRAGEMARQ